MSVLTIERKVLEKNESIAAELRESFNENKIFSINLVMSSIGGLLISTNRHLDCIALSIFFMLLEAVSKPP